MSFALEIGYIAGRQSPAVIDRFHLADPIGRQEFRAAGDAGGTGTDQDRSDENRRNPQTMKPVTPHDGTPVES